MLERYLSRSSFIWAHLIRRCHTGNFGEEKRGNVEIIATMGGSPVMYNFSSLAKTKQEADDGHDGHIGVVQVSPGAAGRSGWLSQWVSRASRAEAAL